MSTDTMDSPMFALPEALLSPFPEEIFDNIVEQLDSLRDLASFARVSQGCYKLVYPDGDPAAKGLGPLRSCHLSVSVTNNAVMETLASRPKKARQVQKLRLRGLQRALPRRELEPMRMHEENDPWYVWYLEGTDVPQDISPVLQHMHNLRSLTFGPWVAAPGQPFLEGLRTACPLLTRVFVQLVLPDISTSNLLPDQDPSLDLSTCFSGIPELTTFLIHIYSPLEGQPPDLRRQRQFYSFSDSLSDLLLRSFSGLRHLSIRLLSDVRSRTPFDLNFPQLEALELFPPIYRPQVDDQLIHNLLQFLHNHPTLRVLYLEETFSLRSFYHASLPNLKRIRCTDSLTIYPVLQAIPNSGGQCRPIRWLRVDPALLTSITPSALMNIVDPALLTNLKPSALMNIATLRVLELRSARQDLYSALYKLGVLPQIVTFGCTVFGETGRGPLPQNPLDIWPKPMSFVADRFPHLCQLKGFVGPNRVLDIAYHCPFNGPASEDEAAGRLFRACPELHVVDQYVRSLPRSARKVKWQKSDVESPDLVWPTFDVVD